METAPSRRRSMPEHAEGRFPFLYKKRSKRYRACSKMVPVAGLEPARINRRILSAMRLPFRHTGM